MFLIDLFVPRSTRTSESRLRPESRSGKPLDGDTGMERFSSSGVMPAEVSAAGVATSDLSQ